MPLLLGLGNRLPEVLVKDEVTTHGNQINQLFTERRCSTNGEASGMIGRDGVGEVYTCESL